MDNDLGLWAVPLAMLGGAIRVSTPFLFVSLGEVLTERSGRINLGLEGTLGFGAMAGYATAVLTGSAWADVGLAALNVNVLFLAGAGLAWMLRATRLGLILRVVGDSTDAARALGLRPNLIRALATAAGGALAGVGGAYLSLYYPGSWNEGLSSGQGLMAVALVIFARWNPLACFGAAILFGGAGALGPALQSVGVSQGYYLFYAAPYVLTLGVMIATARPHQALAGAPGELSITE